MTSIMAKGSQKKVKTRTIVKKLATITQEKSKEFNWSNYEYIEDYWEKSPKTDYTYARSASYRAVYSDKDYISPNMSRRRLRGDSVVTSPVSALTPNISVDLQEPTYRSYSERRKKITPSRGVVLGSGGSMRSHSSIVTRSQSSRESAKLSKFSHSQRSSLNKLLFGRLDAETKDTGASDVTDDGCQWDSHADEARYCDSYTQAAMDKQMEYSGQPIIRKESHINHLYDTESSSLSKSSSTEQTTVHTSSPTSYRSWSRRAWSAIMSVVKSSMMLLWRTTIHSYMLLSSVAISKARDSSSTLQPEPGSANIFWKASKYIYNLFAYTVLYDASLHRRTNIMRGRSRLCWLSLLFVVPFLLYGMCLLSSNSESMSLWFSTYPSFSLLSASSHTSNKERVAVPHGEMYHKLEQLMLALQKQQKEHERTQHNMKIQQADVEKLQAQMHIMAASSDTEQNRVHAHQAHLYEQHADQISRLEGQLLNLTDLWHSTDQQLQLANFGISRKQEQIEAMQKYIGQMEEMYKSLVHQMKNCCTNDTALGILIQTKVAETLSQMTMGEGYGQSSSTMESSGSTNHFQAWLQERFVSLDDLDKKLSAMAAQILTQVKAESSKWSNVTGDMFVNPDGSILTEDNIKQMIKKELYVFNADKTGMVDFALESAGGSVISTRCSKTYSRQTAQISLFGIPLWYERNSPRTVLQPEVHPGKCWAFAGSQGYLVIQLSGQVKTTSFSLEHIPKSLSSSGTIDSAPKHFTVWGLSSEFDTEGRQLGNYTYNADGHPLQYFPVIPPVEKAYNIVEMRIHSNHGNPDFTCIYRFRVHGVLKKT